MGIFDGKTKKLLAESESENNSLKKKLDKLKISFKKLNQKVRLLEIDKKELGITIQTLEMENTAIKQALDKYKILVGDDESDITKSKMILNNLKNEITEKQSDLDCINTGYNQKKSALKELNNQYIVMDEAVLLQSFGLYTPKYNFLSSNNYKEKLEDIRNEQKSMIKDNKAAICLKIWSVEGSTEKGKKLILDNIKQILRTFNIECEHLIRNVRFNNYDSNKQRIEKAFKSLNKLNNSNKIEITNKYLELKLQELDLAFEHAQKVQEEKEYLRQQRELKKEEMRLAKELEEKRQEAEKEQQHYLNALQKLEEQIITEQNEEAVLMLQNKKDELSKKLDDVDKVFKNLDYREANHRAGYVYIISNIGAFGENIYKIGMTRRLEPQDRVDELGGASVPFRFDVHALIFSDDAPKLETSLHNAFESKKINAVNGRKEFFRVTLEEIEAVVKANHDKTVEFNKYPEAQQYRESMKILETKYISK